MTGSLMHAAKKFDTSGGSVALRHHLGHRQRRPDIIELCEPIVRHPVGWVEPFAKPTNSAHGFREELITNSATRARPVRPAMTVLHMAGFGPPNGFPIQMSNSQNQTAKIYKQKSRSTLLHQNVAPRGATRPRF